MVPPFTRALLLVAVALGAVALARCGFSINPDEGHFSCHTSADCASGQECVPQPDAGNGLCYRPGECAPVTDPCGPAQACVDAGCVDCTSCTQAACAGTSCVLDGGADVCVLRNVLPDGGLVDAGTTDAGTLPTTYACGAP